MQSYCRQKKTHLTLNPPTTPLNGNLADFKIYDSLLMCLKTMIHHDMPNHRPSFFINKQNTLILLNN